jgi:hypothetical protein
MWLEPVQQTGSVANKVMNQNLDLTLSNLRLAATILATLVKKSKKAQPG